MSREDLDRLTPDRAGRAQERHRRVGARSIAAPRPRSPLVRKEGDDIERHDRRREQERIDAVEHAAVARDQRPRVLAPGGALDDRLGEVAGLRRERRQRPEDDRVDRVLAERPEHQRDDEGRRETPPTTPSIVLDWRDVGQELRPAEVLADQERPGVVRPHGEDEQEDPAALRRRGPRVARRRDRRRGHPEADQEREQGDVERAEDRGHPRLESVARIDLRERGDADEHDPDPPERSMPLPSNTSGNAASSTTTRARAVPSAANGAEPGGTEEAETPRPRRWP
jgi:hypothetical protein